MHDDDSDEHQVSGFLRGLFLVAGQWDPALVKPLAQQKLWILVSQDDNKAWPGQNAIIDVLEKRVSKSAVQYGTEHGMKSNFVRLLNK